MNRQIRIFYFLFLLAASAGVVSCSTKKDTSIHREYHNITSYFNGYFNAGESVRKGKEKIVAAHKEDYDKILPIFIIGDTATAKGSYPEMEKAIEKCEKVISRHTITNDAKKDKKNPKLNKWIDDNYILLGEAYFYKRNYFKSEEMFQYVNRKFKEKDTQLASAAWLARAAMEKEDMTKALQALSRIEPEEDMDAKVKATYHMVYADYYIRTGKLQRAADEMEEAIKNIKKKKDRARPHFILAQIYQQLNESQNALREYEAVLHSRPNFELEFYAQINKALSFSRRGGSPEEIIKQLEKMAKDEKNKEYLDQIYFALGDIYLEEQKRPESIAYFEKSLKATKADNKKQKSKTFLKLADMYFDQRKYEYAQAYYDSTYTNIDEKHERFEEVKARAENLGELVGYLNTIDLNDSLVVICGMSEAEQDKKLKEIQKQLEREMAEKRQRDEEAAAAAASAGTPSNAVSGTYWAYNDNLKSKGFEQFKDYWGDRPLKDNWRLSSKLSQSFGTPDESVVQQDTTGATQTVQEDKYKVPELAELKASLPCKDKGKMDAASASVAEAYYQSGLIYKEKLDDPDAAINSWEQLVTNMDQSDFHPVAYYQLFRTWLSKEGTKGYKSNPFCSTCNSKYWADQIHELYPNSEWSRLVDNPEFVDQAQMIEAQESEAYQNVYNMYVNRRYQEAIAGCNQVLESEPNNHLLCKYRLLRAVCVGYSDAMYSIKENYFKELDEVRKKCPNTEEATTADQLIRAGNQESPGGTTDQNPVTDTNPKEGGDQKPNNNSGGTNPSDSTVVENPYKLDLSAEHYFAVLMPIQGTDINKLKADVADFNTQYYASSAFKVTNNLLGQQYHIILVKPFKSLAEGKDYMNTFKGDKDKLGDLMSTQPIMFLISKPNYITLFKSKDVNAYLQFYQTNYSN